MNSQDETNPPTVCGEDHPADMYCERCVVTIDMRAKLLATPIYDVAYVEAAIVEVQPSLKETVSLRTLLRQRGYASDACIALDVDDALDEDVARTDSAYAAWVRAMIALLGEHEVRSSYFRIGE